MNIANLLLARGSVRRKELAIRAALGAGRLRIARQLLAESAVLALAGDALGLPLASWGVEFLASGLPEYLINANPRVVMLKIDATALGFTFALSMLTSFLFGLIPALRLSKVDLNEALKEGARTAGTRSRLRQALVVAERTREIGVRMALGAQAGNVMRMVLRHGMALAVAGVMIGLAASFALNRVISGLLFGVQPTDPLTLVAITLLLLAVALVSCLIPARRATKVDPLVALRHE